jgi:hypothetical protein
MIFKSLLPFNKILTVMLLIGLMVTSFAQNISHDFKKVEIQGTELRHLKSEVVNQEYDLYINLPGNYNSSDQNYPVLYLLDAQWDFTLTTALYGEQYYDGFIPEQLIVGITWGGENPNPDYLRGRDFTPSKTEQMPQSGGAEKFLRFIEEELIPFINSNYRTSNDRTIAGSSLGGLFTLYTLFNKPDLFTRYLLTSPASGWDSDIIYSFEGKYAESNPPHSARLFMAMGGAERGVNEFEKLVNHLRDRNYSSIQFETRVLDGIGHSGSKAEGYTRGLQYLFAKTSLKIEAELLKKYSGKYKSDSGNELSLLNKDRNISLINFENENLLLHAESEKSFYYSGEFLNLKFKLSEAGEVKGFNLERFGGSEYYRRIQ